LPFPATSHVIPGYDRESVLVRSPIGVGDDGGVGVGDDGGVGVGDDGGVGVGDDGGVGGRR